MHAGTSFLTDKRHVRCDTSSGEVLQEGWHNLTCGQLSTATSHPRELPNATTCRIHISVCYSVLTVQQTIKYTSRWQCSTNCWAAEVHLATPLSLNGGCRCRQRAPLFTQSDATCHSHTPTSHGMSNHWHAVSERLLSNETCSSQEMCTICLSGSNPRSCHFVQFVSHVEMCGHFFFFFWKQNSGMCCTFAQTQILCASNIRPRPTFHTRCCTSNLEKVNWSLKAPITIPVHENVRQK